MNEAAGRTAAGGALSSETLATFAKNGAPARRVVLLGASNLTRGISTVIETAQNIWGQPLEVLGALGHGRSYGIDSNFLGRMLPGIVQCALWETLSAQPKIPTAALITDIGNDILYEVPVERIISWVETALDRLQEVNARICITLPPIDSAKGLTEARFLFFRHLFFPKCHLELTEVIDRANQLHDRLLQLGTARGVAVVPQQGDWYGTDPIHICLRHWRQAWLEILTPWQDDAKTLSTPARGSMLRWLFLRSRAPYCRKILGVEMHRKQPAAHLRNGTVVSFY